MACTPSARFEEQFENTTSVFAEEGTLAHAIGELIICQRLNLPCESDMAELQAHKLFTPEMLTHCEQYADWCLAEPSKGDIHAVEVKLDLTRYVPEGFGTNDYSRVTPSKRLLRVRDLKYGKGVAVSAIENDQLLVYALGALDWWGWVYDIETVSVGIYQPRINNNSEWEISVRDLLHWAETELAPKAVKAFAGEGEFVPGEHCGFCRGRRECTARADYYLDLFKHELQPKDRLSDAQLIDIVKRGASLVDWFTDIKEHVLAEAVKGKKWPGMKLVEGKSNRVFVSESMTEKKLLDAGHTAIYTPSTLLGVTGLTKVLGAKVFKELVEPDLRKPPGKPTLVSQDDPRPEFDNAQAVFKSVDINNEIEE